MPQKLIIIDGNSFCYRAFYAIRPLSNSKGMPTNAVYGVITMLNKILKEHSPDYFAVCFDHKEKTFRHKRYSEYKSHRKPMPDDLKTQMPIIKKVLDSYRFRTFELEGYEADDLIGTLARRAEKEDFQTFIVTLDKDFGQVVSDKTFLFKVPRMGEGGEIMGVPEILKRWSI